MTEYYDDDTDTDYTDYADYADYTDEDGRRWTPIDYSDASDDDADDTPEDRPFQRTDDGRRRRSTPTPRRRQAKHSKPSILWC